MLEDYSFEGSRCEQQTVVFALVKMCKKLVGALYKKSFAFALVKTKPRLQPQSLASIIDFSSAPQTQRSQPRMTEVLWKDTMSESKSYMQMLEKTAELYEQVLDKAQFFRKFILQVFATVP